jgi:putative transposase
MHQDTVVRFRKKDEVIDPLAELLRRGAKKLIEQAVSEEFEVFLERHAERRDSEGRQAVVRNGYLPQREVLSGIGSVPVKMPRARDRRARACAFAPRWCRRMCAAPRAWTQCCRGCT